MSASQYPIARERLLEVYDVNEDGFVAEDAMSFEDYSSNPSLGVHLTVIGGSADIQHRFRDLLIASPTLQQKYDQLKRQFDGRSMKKYRNAKAVFVDQVLLDNPSKS